MNSDFSRLLTLQRKEHKISQKQAAADLGVSQALLSHYEKGIRECGLDFLVRAAEYYSVSCDYLLGRTEIKRNDYSPSYSEEKLTTEKEIITNSVNHLLDIAKKTDCPELTGSISSYLMVTIYKLWRIVCKKSTPTQSHSFEVSDMVSSELANSVLSINEAKLKSAVKQHESMLIGNDKSDESASMLHVIRYSERTIKQKINTQ